MDKCIHNSTDGTTVEPFFSLTFLPCVYAIWETKTDVTAPSPLLRGQREGRARVVDTIRADAGRTWMRSQEDRDFFHRFTLPTPS